jgi:hypothetical protein
MGQILERKLICGNDTQFADFAAIFIAENICIYGNSLDRGGHILNRGGKYLNRGGKYLNQGGKYLNRGGKYLNRGGKCLNRGGKYLNRGGEDYCFYSRSFFLLLLFLLAPLAPQR